MPDQARKQPVEQPGKKLGRPPKKANYREGRKAFAALLRAAVDEGQTRDGKKDWPHSRYAKAFGTSLTALKDCWRPEDSTLPKVKILRRMLDVHYGDNADFAAARRAMRDQMVAAGADWDELHGSEQDQGERPRAFAFEAESSFAEFAAVAHLGVQGVKRSNDGEEIEISVAINFFRDKKRQHPYTCADGSTGIATIETALAEAIFAVEAENWASDPGSMFHRPLKDGVHPAMSVSPGAVKPSIAIRTRKSGGLLDGSLFDDLYTFVLRRRDVQRGGAIRLTIKVAPDPEMLKIEVAGTQPSRTKRDIFNALVRSAIEKDPRGLLVIDAERTGMD